MRVAVNSKSSRYWGPQAALGVLFACAFSAVVVAEEHFYILRDGRRVGITRSKNELGLRFRHGDDVQASARRLAAGGLGTVENIAAAPDSRMKTLRVAEATAARRRTVLRDPALDDVRPVYRFHGSPTPVVSSGTMAVKIRGDLDDGERAALWRDYGSVEVEPVRGLDGVYLVRPADEDEDEVLLAERLFDDDRTVWAHPNFYRAAKRHQVPADEFFDLQWHLENTGQSGGVVDADIDAPEAWVFSDGSGVLFGMFDDSCDVDHEDLTDNYIGIGQDISLPFFDADYNNPRPKTPQDAHGTAVMGLAVAAANSVGVRGVAYGAQFTASRGLGDFVTELSIANVYTFALDQNVDVHINSWGYVGNLPDPPVIVEAIDKAFREGRDLDGPGGDPARGMVILFSTGNNNAQLTPGFELSALPQVIGVGASTSDDFRAGFSNYGTEMEFLAPGGGNINLGVTTTDTHDDPEGVAQGYNVGGVGVQPGTGNVFGQDIDTEGNYTGFFGGTSAACPVAAGVAGLILSVNPELTATDVRIAMEHSSDQVSPVEAAYDSITSKSFLYGYGRINAQRAVVAASDSLTNGGFTWPDVAANLRVEGSKLRWTATTGADEFLVIEIRNTMEPLQDGACYDADQFGCSGATLTPLPPEASVIFVGCAPGGCAPGSEQSADFVGPVFGITRFGIYARNSIGRYSFGAKAEVAASQAPAVSILASPMQGTSPLSVLFKGNAVSDMPIDESKTAWDFNYDGVTFTKDSGERTASNENDPYIVEAGQSHTFIARLQMCDIEGRCGSEDVSIFVQGPEKDDLGGANDDNDLQIIISLPNAPGSDVNGGTSPLSVVLTVTATGISGTPQVEWDLGDGSQSNSLVVPHTYENVSEVTYRIPITAKVTTTSGNSTVTSMATRIITVEPGTPEVDSGEPVLPGTTPGGEGGSAAPCSGVGMIPLILTLSSVLWLRRRY